MSEPTHPWGWAITPHLWHQQYPKRFTDADIRGFLAFLEEKVPTLPTPYAWIVDTGGLLRANRAQRAMLAAFPCWCHGYVRQDGAPAFGAPHGAPRATGCHELSYTMLTGGGSAAQAAGAPTAPACVSAHSMCVHVRARCGGRPRRRRGCTCAAKPARERSPLRV